MPTVTYADSTFTLREGREEWMLPTIELAEFTLHEDALQRAVAQAQKEADLFFEALQTILSNGLVPLPLVSYVAAQLICRQTVWRISAGTQTR